MRRLMDRTRVLVIPLLCLAAAVPPQATAGDLLNQVRARWQNHKGVPSAESLAVEIEKLEKHIDWYGTIVAKQPDVWGQARLMRHRDEFEKILVAERDKFADSLQGALSRSDQAFLASAFSLAAAVSGSPAVKLPQTAATSRVINTRQRAALKDAGVASPTPDQLTNVTAPTEIPIPTTNPAGDLIDNFDTKGVLQRSDIKTSTTTLGFGPSKLTLEPTEHLNQLGNYVNHLHEIRRINEGDDTSASPGYAMHLVRMPVSILPGSKTRKGYGAEITVTATPVLGRDLLPTTFRNLVINDLVGQIATPIAEAFNSETTRDDLSIFRASKLEYERRNLSNEPGGGGPSYSPELRLPPLPPLPDAPVLTPPAGLDPTIRASRGQFQPAERRVLAQQPVTSKGDLALRRTSAAMQVPGTPESPTSAANRQQDSILNRQIASGAVISRPMGPLGAALAKTKTGKYSDPLLNMCTSDPDSRECSAVAVANQAVQGLFTNLGSNSVPALRSRNSRFGFPGTQLFEVYGKELIKPVVLQAYDVFLTNQLADKDQPEIVQYHKVAGFVQDQVTAAYDLLSRPESGPIWDSFATPELTPRHPGSRRAGAGGHPVELPRLAAQRRDRHAVPLPRPPHHRLAPADAQPWPYPGHPRHGAGSGGRRHDRQHDVLPPL